MNNPISADKKIYIGLGSNLGSKINNLRDAVNLIKTRCAPCNLKSSPVITTKAILPSYAPSSWDIPYLNAVISFEADITPHKLLKILKEIEVELGREENYAKWSPRTIDLDILIFQDLVLKDPLLEIPHKELSKRPFLLHLLKLIGCNHKIVQNFIPENDPVSESFILNPGIMGIVNLTLDSFSDGGKYFNPALAFVKALELAKEGASIIDIGAQSTRPGAKIIGSDEEIKRLKPALDLLKPLMEKGDLKVSIDSFWPEVITKVLNEYNIAWINDVNCALDDATLSLIAEKKCKYCAMHSLGVPSNPNIYLSSDNILKTLKEWAQNMLDKLEKKNISYENIIFDPGIGFGKNVYQSIEILSSLKEFKELGVKSLIGHSRKSFINAISNLSPDQRDAETIAISLAIYNDVDFLRVHNVKDHMRALAAYDLINN